MGLIRWKESWRIGVASLDRDHRALVRMVNRFHEAARKGENPSHLRLLFEEIVDHAREHFAREEEMMERAGFRRRLWYRETHQRFLGHLIEYCRTCLMGEVLPDLSEEAGAFLHHWVVDHLEEDFCYKVFLKNRGMA